MGREENGKAERRSKGIKERKKEEEISKERVMEGKRGERKQKENGK